MAVVIDDFEVLTDEDGGHQQASPAGTAPAPTVRDIERVVERQSDRDERVWAH